MASDISTESRSGDFDQEEFPALTMTFQGMSLNSTTSISDGSGAEQVGPGHHDIPHAVDPRPVLDAPVEPGPCELGTKELGKPGTFKGEDDRWAEWAFVMRGWMVMSNLITTETLRRVEQFGRATVEADVPEYFKDQNHKLYFALVMLLRGHAQTLLRI